MAKYGIGTISRDKSTNIVDVRKTGNKPGKKMPGKKLDTTSSVSTNKTTKEKKQQQIDNIVNYYEGKGKTPEVFNPQPTKKNPKIKINQPSNRRTGGSF